MPVWDLMRWEIHMRMGRLHINTSEARRKWTEVATKVVADLDVESHAVIIRNILACTAGDGIED